MAIQLSRVLLFFAITCVEAQYDSEMYSLPESTTTCSDDPCYPGVRCFDFTGTDFEEDYVLYQENAPAYAYLNFQCGPCPDGVKPKGLECHERIFVEDIFHFSSINFPSYYIDLFYQAWYFHTSLGKRFFLTFISFNTERLFDVVRVGEGAFIDREELLLWSGTARPGQVRVLSRSNLIWMTFITDGSVIDTGIRGFVRTANYLQPEIDCHVDFDCLNGACLPFSEDLIYNAVENCGSSVDSLLLNTTSEEAFELYCPNGQLDSFGCLDARGCSENPCFPGVRCTEVITEDPEFITDFSLERWINGYLPYQCDACPEGLRGNGIDCFESPLEVQCPQDLIKYVPRTQSEVEVTWQEPSAVSNGIMVPYTSRSHGPGSSFRHGTSVVSYVFYDQKGNEAVCNFLVTVIEDTAINKVCNMDYPCINGGTCVIDNTDEGYHCDCVLGFSGTNCETCRLGYVINCPQRTMSYTAVGELTPVSWDLVPTVVFLDIAEDDTVEMISDVSPGESFPVGVTSVVYSLACFQCHFRLNIVDLRVPDVLDCPSDIRKGLPVKDDTISIYWEEPTATDFETNPVNIRSTHSSGDLFGVGRTEVEYTFSDNSGNTNTCSFYVTILESITNPPEVVQCPSQPIEKLVQRGKSGTQVTWLEPFAVDILGTLVENVMATSHPGDTFSVGTTKVDYNFTDSFGNFAECTFHVVVTPTEGPIVEPQTFFRNCSQTIVTSLPSSNNVVSVKWNEPTVVLGERSVFVYQNYHPGDFFPVGETEVTYTVQGSTTAKCTFIIKVIDLHPPVVLNCPSSQTILSCSRDPVVVTWEEPSAYDNAGEVTMKQSHYSYVTGFHTGVTPVMYIFNDVAGNSAICTFNITIENSHCIPSNNLTRLIVFLSMLLVLIFYFLVAVCFNCFKGNHNKDTRRT